MKDFLGNELKVGDKIVVADYKAGSDDLRLRVDTIKGLWNTKILSFIETEYSTFNSDEVLKYNW